MKVIFESVAHIKGVGFFKETEKHSWGLVQWDRIDGEGFIVVKDTNFSDFLLSQVLKTNLFEENISFDIVLCSPNIAELIKTRKDEKDKI